MEAINEHQKEEFAKSQKKLKDREKKGPILPVLQPKVPVLDIGTKVRVALDKPKGVLGTKLGGNFRATDTRWELKISTITNILLTPDQPVLYQVDNEPTGYTRNQLQLVDENEKQPDNSLLSPENPKPKPKPKKPTKKKPIPEPEPEPEPQPEPQPQPIPEPQPQLIPEQKSRSGRIIKPKKFFDS